MQVGFGGNVPNFALTTADEGRSTATARPPETNSRTLPALEEVEETRQTATDERSDTQARPKQETQSANTAQSTTAEISDESKRRLEEERQQQRAQERLQDRQESAELQEIRALADRDREVRAHEQAHQAVGGQYAGSASYTYETGPNGVKYAVGGEVPIDISKVPDNPEATLQKADTVRRAALAPPEPSPQDRQVAAQAVQLALEARSEIQQKQREETQVEDTEESGNESDEVAEDTSATQAADEQDAEQRDTALADATDRLIELNEELSQIYENLLAVGQFEESTNVSQLLDLDA